VIKGSSMRIAQHLVKLALVLLMGCATVELGRAQSDVTKTFVDRLIDQVTKLEKSCAKEIKKFCSTVTPGEGRVIYCMQAHEDKLSPGCSYDLQDVVLALQSSNEVLKEAVTACRADISAKCGTVQPGKGRIAACLVAEKASVSKDCAAAIEKVEKVKTQ
jgi:cysteine rich repeat protein